MNQRQLLVLMTKYLRKHKYKVTETKQYILAEGELPVCLVAHLDTVGELLNNKQENVIYDDKQDILHVLGGHTLDDRLGVWLIIQMIEMGKKPSIIFTTDEELGGLAAADIVTSYPICPLEKIDFIIELDRKGFNDSVYYTCGNIEFQNYINSFGFETAEGSFTDCLILGEAWDIAAVNLSISYYNEHTYYEYAHLKGALSTLDKVVKILDDWTGHYNLIPLDLKYYKENGRTFRYAKNCGKFNR